jgi:hypothetical protein
MMDKSAGGIFGNQKGFTLTLDAIIAILFIMSISLAISAYRYTETTETSRGAFLNLHYVAEDALDVLNKQGIVDSISFYYILSQQANESDEIEGNLSMASNLSMQYLDVLVPTTIGYRLVVEEGNESTTIAESESRIGYDPSTVLTHARRLVVGYTKDNIPLDMTDPGLFWSLGAPSAVFSFWGPLTFKLIVWI